MERAKPQNVRTGCLLFGAFGLFLTLLALGRSDLDYLYKLDGRETVGTVLYSGETYSSRQSQSYITYEFVLPDGRAFQCSQTNYSGTRGKPVRIQYLGALPSFNRVAGSEPKNQQWLLLCILGVLMMGLSIHWLVTNPKHTALAI
jgi:hypothetical protein